MLLENINFTFQGDKTLSEKNRVGMLENAMSELTRRVEHCFDRLSEGISEDKIRQIISEYNLGYTRNIEFTENGFILTFSTSDGDYTNTFEVVKNSGGLITNIKNITAEREITVTYNNETEVT